MRLELAEQHRNKMVKLFEPEHSKTNKMTCALSKDFAVHLNKVWVPKLCINRTAKTLIRLGGCLG